MSRWQRMQELFDETVDLEPQMRARRLHERTGGDTELIRLVEELAAADRPSHAAFERSAAEILGTAFAPEAPPQELCGQTFGAYRVDEHLSSGGMGHVYRATRSAAGTERRVALKVLRPSLDPEAFLTRFQREREVLAGLEHEHIVAFLDAGALPDGRPFLVMEFVDGIPLTQWARGAGATPRLRIELFLEVCAAVQYAHEKLVVHRDLKPSNVLVTSKGTPKLLDFGVASVLARDPDSTGGAPLTPAYAAPEALSGARPTAACDVFSLGVLLFELLTGKLPRAEPPVALGRDLAAVVAQATHPDPERRYASVDRLGDDLRRHLAGEPVAARAGGFPYRAACFARRRRWAILATAAVASALIVGWVSSDLRRRSAERESSRGWRAHAEAKAVARVLEGWVLGAAGTDAELGARAAEHLEAALDGDLAEFPESETLVRLTLAQLYLARGENEEARRHADRAFELAQATSGVGPAERERAAELRERAAAPPPEQPGARAHHWLVYDESRKSVLLCGGSTAKGEESVFYDDVWSFDGARWSRVGSLARPESGLRVVSRPGAGLTAFGGFRGAGEVVGDLRAWVDGSWEVLDEASEQAVAESGFVFDLARERFVLFGGALGGEKRGTTWEWDGQAWKRFDVEAPAARMTHGMVYDRRRGVTVLFGGTADRARGDTWEWNGSVWREVAGSGPPARYAGAMTYDAKRGRTVLFGGGGKGGALGDTWTFDGTRWTELGGTGPSPRFSPAMAYDESRDVIVLFGGRRSWPDDLADTWTFDGTSWKRVAGP